ncbi:beta-hexosaminidase [Acidobacteriota bacterium]|nr:beta-hexosaminidase [Acidobacteriota bacterium]
MASHPSEDILWAGFQGRTVEEVSNHLQPGALILFGRNLNSDPERGPAQCFEMLQGLQARWGRKAPLPIAIDQEGGAVSRLRPWVGETPSFKNIFQTGGAEACYLWGSLWGEGCALLGINIDFAPVADRWDGHVDTGMGDRCVSENAQDVIVAVDAYLRGMEAHRVQGCLKHFPGLGGTLIDSHQGLPSLEDAETLALNAFPFQKLSKAHRLVMVAHLKTPTSDPLPLSMHPLGAQKNQYGVEGIFIPDDLEMGGCQRWSWDERVRHCLIAGHDWMLVCQTDAGVQQCADALKTLQEELWSPARQRGWMYRDTLPDLGGDSFNTRAWKDWTQRVQAAAEKF